MAIVRRILGKLKAAVRTGLEDKFWPILAAMVVFGGVLIGTALSVLRFDDPRWYFNAWTSLLAVPLAIVLAGIALSLLGNRTLRRTTQFALVLALIAHSVALMVMHRTEIVSKPPNPPRERDEVVQEEPVLPDYQTWRIDRPRQRSQDHLPPLETETAQVEIDPLARRQSDTDSTPAAPVRDPLESAESSIVEPSIVEPAEALPSQPLHGPQDISLSRQASRAEPHPSLAATSTEALAAEPDAAHVVPLQAQETTLAAAAPTNLQIAATAQPAISDPSILVELPLVDRAARLPRSPFAPTVVQGSDSVAVPRTTTDASPNTLTSASRETTLRAPTTDSRPQLRPSSSSLAQQATISPAATINSVSRPLTVRSPAVAIARSDAPRADTSTEPTIQPNRPESRLIARSTLVGPQVASPTIVESPALARAPRSRAPSARPARVALSRSLAGVAGVGRSLNLDTDVDAAEGPAEAASGSFERARATQTTPPDVDPSPSEPARISRSRADAAVPRSTLAAAPVVRPTASAMQQPSPVNASASAALSATSARADTGLVSAQAGNLRVDLGPSSTVSEQVIDRAAGGGQAVLNFESPAHTLARSATGGGQLLALVSDLQADLPTAPADGGAAPAELPSDLDAIAALVAEAGGDEPTSGGPTAATRQGPPSEISTAALAAATAIPRAEPAESAPGDISPGGGRDTGDEEINRRLTRSDLTGAPVVALTARVEPAIAPVATDDSAKAALDVDVFDAASAPLLAPAAEIVAAAAGRLPTDIPAVAYQVETGLENRPVSHDAPLVQIALSAPLDRQDAVSAPRTSTSAVTTTDAYRGRTARKRGNQRGGGPAEPSPRTEQAIELGLLFLARHQSSDGRWTLSQAYTRESGDEEPIAILRSDAAATGLALLAFQGAGYNHRQLAYRDAVSRGLDWLLTHQKADGDLFVEADEISNRAVRFYSHSIATIALCEAYGMTGDAALREPAQRALNFIVAVQHPQQGGWRYQPGVGSDTSVSGWMMMALKSGELANLEVPRDTYRRIESWLDEAQASKTERHLYRYNPHAPDTNQQRHGRQPSETMTSVGLLMRLYGGWRREHPDMVNGADYLLENLPSIGSRGNPQRDTYYWYYATQVMFHMGGDYWRQWNESLHPLLVENQVQQGPLAGSWNPLEPVPDRWGSHAGRLYVTTMNLLSLEVFYRHLPLYDHTAQ